MYFESITAVSLITCIEYYYGSITVFSISSLVKSWVPQVNIGVAQIIWRVREELGQEMASQLRSEWHVKGRVYGESDLESKVYTKPLW